MEKTKLNIGSGVRPLNKSGNVAFILLSAYRQTGTPAS